MTWSLGNFTRNMELGKLSGTSPRCRITSDFLSRVSFVDTAPCVTSLSQDCGSLLGQRDRMFKMHRKPSRRRDYGPPIVPHFRRKGIRLDHRLNREGHPYAKTRPAPRGT